MHAHPAAISEGYVATLNLPKVTLKVLQFVNHSKIISKAEVYQKDLTKDCNHLHVFLKIAKPTNIYDAWE